MSTTDIIKLCHANHIRDTTIIDEIVRIGLRFQRNLNRQMREINEYIRAVRDYA